MIEIVKESDEFEKFNDIHKKGHIFQSKPWANLKKDWIREIIIIRDDNKQIIAGMSVLIRPLSKFSLMYSPRGPVCDMDDVNSLKQLYDGALELARKYNAVELKIDPDISDENHISNMGKAGFTPPRNGEFIQPKIVYRMDIENLSTESLMERFHHKTRYNIRLAARKGVTVCQENTVDEFYRLLLITGERDGFGSRSKEYFQGMLDILGNDYCRLYVAYYEEKAIAATIALHSGDKTWYVYGASDNEHRNVMPNYLLQMQMINWAIQTKSRIYDFRGVTDYKGDILQGLVTFKKGFSAVETVFPGEYRVIYKPLVSKGFSSAMSIRKLLRKLRK